MGHKKIQRIDPLTVKLPAGGVDSHAHLDSAEFETDLDAVIERAMLAGVTGIGNVFLSPGAYEQTKSRFDKWPGIFFLLGIHPCDGRSCTPACLEQIEAVARRDSRIRAIGEIGLDYHWDDCPRELQIEAFARQLELAKKLAMPVVVHCREAEADCLTFLEAGGFRDYPLLWHCFGGDAALARRIVRNGWHISIPGPVTYPANEALRSALKEIPDERLLLETDCPYLSPVPWRGQANEPAFIVFTARKVAEAREVAPDVLWRICGDNARRFFGWPPDGKGRETGAASRTSL